MSQRPIMDAGPGLNFFALNKERLLFGVLGSLAIPEIVRDEILQKAEQEQRFAAAERVLSKVPERLLKILSDDYSQELAHAVQRIAGMPIQNRRRSRKDLGETMVIAHAVVAAESGSRVFVLIDDEDGRKHAAREEARLKRLRQNSVPVGSIELLSTVFVLKKAAGSEYIPDRRSMRNLYDRLRTLDDGIVPLEQTDLMALSCWS